MIDGLFNQSNYLAAKRMLEATALRHEAIAGNLANIETPGYKRVDVAANFMTELHQAIASQDPARISSVQPKLELDPHAVAQSPDGNTVNLETELTNLQQNTLAHTLETQLISSSLLKLRLAITGRSN